MKTQLYTITALTNLHVGAGEINFNVIDNQVQRDPITKLPNINASSLKGAFREHFSKDGESGMVKYIFGPDNGDNDAHTTGAFSFFEASLLTRPVRSNIHAYFNATSPKILQNLLETIENFGIEFDEELRSELQKLAQIEVKKREPLVLTETKERVYLEDYEAKPLQHDTSKLSKLLGDNIALFDINDLAQIDLPVLARNYLENGESKNLWYEEIVPKASRFFFSIAKPTNVDEKDKKEKIAGFERRFENEGNIVQIGANKSIGYGFCKIERVSK